MSTSGDAKYTSYRIATGKTGIQTTLRESRTLGDSDAWRKDVPVEESAYYYHGVPLLTPRRYEPKGLTVAEFFSGLGGMSAGFEMAGFACVLGADIHVPSTLTFAQSHPAAHTLLGNLTTIDEGMASELAGSPDVVAAGIPCQGFSLNNRKRHADDKRNFLFLDLMRFLARLRPRMVVIENVGGLRSMSGGAFVGEIEAALREVGFPFVDHRLLNALDYGVPQSRQRLFFVARRDGEPFEWPLPTHGPKGGLPARTVCDALGDLPPLGLGETATAYPSGPTGPYQTLMRGTESVLTNHQAPSHPEETVRRIAETLPGRPMYPAFKQRIRLAWDEPSPTQVSGGIRPQFQFGHPDQPRGLTIRERCRIQSIPDRFHVQGGLVQGRVQTGNAVPPLLAKAIAESCLAYLGEPGR